MWSERVFTVRACHFCYHDNALHLYDVIDDPSRKTRESHLVKSNLLLRCLAPDV